MTQNAYKKAADEPTTTTSALEDQSNIDFTSTDIVAGVTPRSQYVKSEEGLSLKETQTNVFENGADRN